MRAFSAAIICGAISFAAVEARNGVLDPPTIRALTQNGRVITHELEYRGIARADTGFSVEDCLRFRDRAGRRFYLRKVGLERRKFLLYGSYRLDLRFVGYTKRGIPLARAAARTLLVGVKAPYEGDIRERDPREKEIKKDIIAGKAPPEFIRLRYSGTRGDFAAFYDLVGRAVYFRYRKDRFDDLGAKKIRTLVKGEAYAVHGTYLGVQYQKEFISVNERDPKKRAAYNRLLREKSSILVFNFTKAVPLRLEQIIF